MEIKLEIRIETMIEFKVEINSYQNKNKQNKYELI